MCEYRKYIYIVLFLIYGSKSQLWDNETLVVPTEASLSDYDWNVWCKLQPNGYDCNGKGRSDPKFYYDLKMEDCKTFNFGHCQHSKNHFVTLSECHDKCRDPGLHIVKANLSDKIICRFQPDFGQCNNYYPMWYFDLTHRTCKGFSYSGCGGNLNRFATAQSCSATCAAIVEY